METILTPKRVTHTYTSKEGVVVVVLGVPALYATNPDGREEHVYDWDVAGRLESLIKQAVLRNPTPGTVHTKHWDEDVPEIPVDLEVRVRGLNIGYGKATVKVWRSMFDRISTAHRAVAKVLAERRGASSAEIPSPVVAFVGDGSLTVGLRTLPQMHLFSEEESPQNIALQAIRLIVDAADWAVGEEDTLPLGVREDPALLDTVLRAVEELSPTTNDEIQKVELVPKFESRSQRRSITLVAGTRERVAKRRMDIVLGSGEAREVVLAGIIDTIKLDGEFHIREIGRGSSDWDRPTARWTYGNALLSDLLRFFGRKVRVSGIQRMERGRWARRLEALEIRPVDED